MNKVLVILFCGMVIFMMECTGSNASKNNDTPDSDTAVVKKKAKIKSIHEECLNYLHGEYKELSYAETINYFEDGRECNQEIHDGNGTSSITNSIYDNNKLVRKDSKIDKNRIYSVYYYYDQSGRVEYITDGERPKPVERYTYNSNGQKEWTYVYDGESDRQLYANHYDYDSQGHVALETQYDDKGKEILEKHTYLYNDKGYLLKEDFLERFDGDIHIAYEYKAYDEEGNWTICIKTERHDAEGVEYKSKTTRSYVYY